MFQDTYLLISDYNDSGTLTFRTARIEVAKPADPTGALDKYYYSAQYDISATGYVVYTHVYDVITGDEIAELSGNGYITPGTIINNIHDLINQAEMDADLAARLAAEAAAAAQTDIDGVTVVGQSAEQEQGILTP